MTNSKQIVIRDETLEMIKEFKVGDESYNSVIFRIFKKVKNDKK